MYELVRYKKDYLEHKFVTTVFRKNNALIIDITGPDDHLGGIGIGIPYQRKNNEFSANLSCFSFPSHRDGELAGILAQKIAKITQCHTIVFMGIHIPDISETQLKDVIQFLKDWISDIGNNLVKNIFSNLDIAKHK